MKLFCEKCGKVHAFSEQEAEQLIYILQAETSDLIAGMAIFYVSRDDTPESRCLTDILDAGLEAESYSEHVKSMFHGRAHCERQEE
jgi:hypothetical protein